MYQIMMWPFNHLLLIAIKRITAALTAGNSVIVKPFRGDTFHMAERLIVSYSWSYSQLAPICVLEVGFILRALGCPD